MTRGIYAGAAGMYAQQQALDVIANNLANVATTGFKSDRLTFREALDREVSAPGEVRPRPVGRLGGGALAEGRAFTSDQGPALRTGNPLDLAVEGGAYFSVRAPAGVRYTRNGSFQIGPDGKLTTRAGLPVLGLKGEIAVPAGATVSFDASGGVYTDGRQLDRLALVTGQLTKEGEGLFGGPAQPATNATVTSGQLEGSNVNAIREMVAMIQTMRVFEANQKVVQAHDETLNKAISSLARV